MRPFVHIAHFWRLKGESRLSYAFNVNPLQTYPRFHSSCFVCLEEDRTDWDGVRNPLDESTFFIQSDHTIGAYICTYMFSSAASRYSEHNSRSWRLRDSEFALRSLLMILLRSMMRASFRRSSFGFPRNMYTWPLLPRIEILRGLARDCMTWISSANSVKTGVIRRLEERPDYAFAPSKVGAFGGKG
jgi:hypothetical protein